MCVYIVKAPFLIFPGMIYVMHVLVVVCTGYTEDVLGYIRESVAKNMLADLKDSVKNGRSLNMQDKYGAAAVSEHSQSHTHTLLCTHTHTHAPMYKS